MKMECNNLQVTLDESQKPELVNVRLDENSQKTGAYIIDQSLTRKIADLHEKNSQLHAQVRIQIECKI